MTRPYKPKLSLTRRNVARLDSFLDDAGKTVFVTYSKGKLVFKHRYAHKPLATVDVRLAFKAEMLPMFAVNGFDIPNGGKIVLVPNP